MKVLFIYLSQESGSYLARKREYYISRMPQLGLQYLCAVLNTLGVENDIFDQTINGITLEELVKKLEHEKYDLIGFYTDTTLKPKVITWIKALKATDCSIVIIVGGPGTVNKEEYLSAGCDIALHGEGERTICEIVEYLQKRRPLQEVKGISFMREGMIVDTKPQNMIDNLDDIPFPDRDKIPVRYYYNYHIFNMRTPFTSMITSRGCAFNCSFCCSPGNWHRRIRQRSPENIVAEIDEVVKKYNIKYISFKDDVFGLDRNWAEKFCDLLASRRYDLCWMCLVHPFSFKGHEEEMLGKLRKAGCNTLIMGLQSADPGILKNINRHPDEPQSAKKLIGLAKQKQFLTALQFIIGLPGDTVESIERTIDFSFSVRPHYAEFYSLEKLEGSELEAHYKDAPACSLSSQEIKRWTAYAMRKYYTDPRNVLQNFVYVARHNPRWFIKAARYFGYFSEAIGWKNSYSRSKEQYAMLETANAPTS